MPKAIANLLQGVLRLRKFTVKFRENIAVKEMNTAANLNDEYWISIDGVVSINSPSHKERRRTSAEMHHSAMAPENNPNE